MTDNTDRASRSGIDRAFDGVLAVAQGAAAVATLLCAVLATADVLGSWLLHRAILGSVEFTQALLVVIIFFGLGVAERHEDHIVVDLIRNLTGPRVWLAMSMASRLLTLAVYLAIGIAGCAAFARSWSIGEYAVGPAPFPLWPFRLGLAAGALLASAYLAYTIGLSVFRRRMARHQD